MKPWLVGLVATFFLSGCVSMAHRSETYTNEAWIIEKDPLNSDRCVLRNKYGDLVGYAERDLLSPDRIIIRNKHGDRTSAIIINGEPFKKQ